MSEQKELRGISVEYITYILDLHGIAFELITEPPLWSDALQSIGRKETVDLILTAKVTEERKKSMLFTDEYIAPPWVIFTRDDSPFISGVQDLSGKTVSIQQGFVMEGLLNESYPEIRTLAFDGAHATEDALRALAVGEVDAFIGNLATGSYLIHEQSLLNVKVAAPTPFGNHENAMAVRDDWPQLVSIINKTLKSIPQETKDAFSNKYLAVRYDHGLRSSDILIWVSVSILVSGLIILMIILINKRLRKEIRRRGEVERELREYVALIDENIISETFNREGFITDASAAFYRISGYTAREIIGKHVTEIWSDRAPASYFEKIMRVMDEEGCYEGELEKQAKDGSIFWVKILIIPKHDASGEGIIGYNSIGQDITDKKKVEQLSVTDPLTGLYNRMKLNELMNSEITRARRYRTRFSVIMIDIDDFKQVNDIYGHHAGDIALKQLALILRDYSRSTDLSFRYGGEEFLLLCPETDLQSALVLAEHLRRDVEKAHIAKVGKLTISAGVSTFKSSDSSLSLINRADSSLYEAKRDGKNQVRSDADTELLKS